MRKMMTQLVSVGVTTLLPLLALATTDSPPHQQSFTGLVSTVHAKDHTFLLQGLDKEIQLGAECVITLPDRSPGRIDDLRSGERATVEFHEARGVLVGDRVDIQELAVH